jgi:hypothetical protein
MLSGNINHIVIKNVELASIYINFFTLMKKMLRENINQIVIKKMLRLKVNKFRFVTKT